MWLIFVALYPQALSFHPLFAKMTKVGLWVKCRCSDHQNFVADFWSLIWCWHSVFLWIWVCLRSAKSHSSRLLLLLKHVFLLFFYTFLEYFYKNKSITLFSWFYLWAKWNCFSIFADGTCYVLIGSAVGCCSFQQINFRCIVSTLCLSAKEMELPWQLNVHITSKTKITSQKQPNFLASLRILKFTVSQNLFTFLNLIWK